MISKAFSHERVKEGVPARAGLLARHVMEFVRQRPKQLPLKSALELVVVGIKRNKDGMAVRCETPDAGFGNHPAGIVAHDDVHIAGNR